MIQIKILINKYHNRQTKPGLYKPTTQTTSHTTSNPMDSIEHITVKTNGIKLHVAVAGAGQPVLLLHGFPELWYSWRHQIDFLSSTGYRAIAPDLRGYGDSDAPPSSDKYTALHIVGDLVGMLDEMGIEKVFLVGHDWGALIAWYFCLFRPDRIKSAVILSVQYFPRTPTPFIQGFKAALGDQFYMVRFQVISVSVYNSIILSILTVNIIF